MLKSRVIRTTITIGDETKSYLSKGERLADGKVYMRQDFTVKSYINVGSTGLHTAEINLWNLSDKSSKEIEQKGILVTLEAGYEGKTGKIFEGKISSVTRTKSSSVETNIVTTLYCVSGLNFLQNSSFSEAIVFEDLRSVLGRLADRLGLSPVIDNQVEGTISNASLEGDVLTILKNLSTEFNFNFYWTETRLYIKAVLPIEQVPIAKKYTPENGLLDIPVVTEIGVNIKVFLDPNISPGDGFSLDSKFANFAIGGLNFVDRIRGDQIKTFGREINNNRYQGNYQALEILHEGSSHEDTWQTQINAMGAYNLQNINNTERLAIT
ncbi:MAG TPA: hypothetical protein PKK61_04425 [Defluviitaleaceae bacterium]|nr:hypothetical protein [Defluviitaleaceae bacterium]